MFKKYLPLAILLLPFTPFTKEIGMFKVGTVDIDLITYPFYMLSFMVFLLSNKISLSRKESFIFLIILIIGLLNTLLFNLPAILFFKQFLPIFIFYMVAKVVTTYADPLYVFQQYVKYAVAAAVIGIFQFMLKLIGIKFLTGFDQLFLDSVALEPSHYIIMVLPAFIYLYEQKKFKWKIVVLGISLILTFKLTFILTLVTYYMIKNYKKFKFLLFVLPFLIFLAYKIIYLVPEFAWRIDSLLIFLESGEIRSIDNLTVFSFISNLQIAIQSFKQTYGFGIGLGGHETLYIRHFDADILSEAWYGTNMKAAHCLLIRITSELGIFGLFILFMLFYKTLKIQEIQYKFVALASISHFVGKFYKTGSYFDYGAIFFLVMIITMVKLDEQQKLQRKKVLR